MDRFTMLLALFLAVAPLGQCNQRLLQLMQAERHNKTEDLVAYDKQYDYDYWQPDASEERGDVEPSVVIHKSERADKLERAGGQGEEPSPTNNGTASPSTTTTSSARKSSGKSKEKEKMERQMAEDKLYRKETIKRLLLQKLQMTKFPNLTGVPKYTIPDHILWGKGRGGKVGEGGSMRDGPALQSLDDDPNGKAEINRAIAFAESTSGVATIPQGPGDVLTFELPENFQQMGIAKLSLYVRGVKSSMIRGGKRRYATLRIYSVAATESDNPGAAMLDQLSDKKSYSTETVRVVEKVRLREHGAWHSVPVTKELARWLSSGAGMTSRKFSLRVHLSMYNDAPRENGVGQGLLVLNPETTEDQEHTAFLDMRLDKRSGRNRRGIGMSCSQRSPEKRCCKYEYTVNFDEFGEEFDFILSPRRYHAGYCSGKCPPYFLTLQTSTLFAAESSRNAKRREPCCTPNEVKSLRMMYYNDDRMLMSGTIPGMVIESCGCA